MNWDVVTAPLRWLAMITQLNGCTGWKIKRIKYSKDFIIRKKGTNTHHSIACITATRQKKGADAPWYPQNETLDKVWSPAVIASKRRFEPMPQQSQVLWGIFSGDVALHGTPDMLLFNRVHVWIREGHFSIRMPSYILSCCADDALSSWRIQFDVPPKTRSIKGSKCCCWRSP